MVRMPYILESNKDVGGGGSVPILQAAEKTWRDLALSFAAFARQITCVEAVKGANQPFYDHISSATMATFYGCQITNGPDSI